MRTFARNLNVVVKQACITPEQLMPYVERKQGTEVHSFTRAGDDTAFTVLMMTSSAVWPSDFDRGLAEFLGVPLARISCVGVGKGVSSDKVVARPHAGVCGPRRKPRKKAHKATVITARLS
jgi:hypothetical protein